MLDPMRERSDLRTSVVAVAAGAGVLGGHWAAYRVTLPEANLRDHVLAQAGHGYWAIAARGGVALALAAVVAVVLRGVRGGGGAPSTRSRTVALAWRLAALQVVGFVVLEVVERVASGASLAGLLSHRLLAAGVLIQVLVSMASALAMVLLHRAAAVIGQALRNRPEPGLPAPRLGPTRTGALIRLTLAGAAGLRSPPVS
jgi:hypothetical protein